MGYRAQLLTVSLLVLPLLGGCKQQKYEFETRGPAHAGQGKIVLTVDKTGNGKIHLKFAHLAPPERIDSSYHSYVVWMAPANGDHPYKLGVLDYDPKKRTGSLDATFSDDRMRVIVTLEKHANIGVPTGVRVLEQEVVAPEP